MKSVKTEVDEQTLGAFAHRTSEGMAEHGFDPTCRFCRHTLVRTCFVRELRLVTLAIVAAVVYALDYAFWLQDAPGWWASLDDFPTWLLCIFIWTVIAGILGGYRAMGFLTAASAGFGGHDKCS